MIKRLTRVRTWVINVALAVMPNQWRQSSTRGEFLWLIIYLFICKVCLRASRSQRGLKLVCNDSQTYREKRNSDNNNNNKFNKNRTTYIKSIVIGEVLYFPTRLFTQRANLYFSLALPSRSIPAVKAWKQVILTTSLKNRITGIIIVYAKFSSNYFTRYTLFYVRMLFFRPRLNILSANLGLKIFLYFS